MEGHRPVLGLIRIGVRVLEHTRDIVDISTKALDQCQRVQTETTPSEWWHVTLTPTYPFLYNVTLRVASHAEALVVLRIKKVLQVVDAQLPYDIHPGLGHHGANSGLHQLPLHLRSPRAVRSAGVIIAPFPGSAWSKSRYVTGILVPSVVLL